MRSEVKEVILAAVLLEWEIKGSSGRCTGEVIGTAPPEQAGGAGHADARGASTTYSTTCAEEIVAEKHKAGSRRSQESAVAAADPPRPAPWRAQASPRAPWLQSGNRIAVHGPVGPARASTVETDPPAGPGMERSWVVVQLVGKKKLEVEAREEE